MTDTAIPVLPVTHPAGGYDRNDGLEGKDAAFLVGLHNEGAVRENIRKTLGNRFEVERLGRDIAVQTERLERENQNRLREMQDYIRSEAEKTRELIMNGETKKLQDEVQSMKTQQIIDAAIKAALAAVAP